MEEKVNGTEQVNEAEKATEMKTEAMSDNETREAEKKGVFDEKDIKKADGKKGEKFKATTMKVLKVLGPMLAGSGLTLGVLFLRGFLMSNHEVSEASDRYPYGSNEIPAIPQANPVPQIIQNEALNQSVENLVDAMNVPVEAMESSEF